jgi:hypothetical protein
MAIIEMFPHGPPVDLDPTAPNASQSAPAATSSGTRTEAVTQRASELARDGAVGPSHEADQPVRLATEGGETGLRVMTAPRVVLTAVAIVVLAATIAFIALRPRRPVAAPPSVGALVVSSDPQGAEILIDGAVRGTTPTSLSVAPGQHLLEVRGAETAQNMTVAITPGAQLSQHFNLDPAAKPGQLDVRATAGDQILVDGTLRGRAPLTVLNLRPGSHVVEVRSGAQSVRHSVTVQSDVTSTLFVATVSNPPVPASASAGWLSIAVPFEVELFEGGRLVGNSRSGRILLPAGRHELDIVSVPLGLQVRKVVDIEPAGTFVLPIEVPNGTLNINAAPWAEVFLDGRPLGETPLAHVSASAGRHEVILKHPQLGERTVTVDVPSGALRRVSVDLSK